MYNATNKHTKENVAIKVINKAALKGKDEALKNEIDVLKRYMKLFFHFVHLLIVHLYSCFMSILA